MKSKLKFIKQQFSFKNKSRKSILLSVVALIEVLAIIVVSTYAWIETASTIIIQTDGEQKIDSYIYTNAEISKDTKNTIDLSKYFRASGNVHLASAASANGSDLYFPRVASTNSNISFRQGSINDKNTNYISFSFNVTAKGTDAKFIFAAVPTITIGGEAVPENSVRVAVNDGATTQIFSDKATTENVRINGILTATNILAFKDYADGTVASDESRVLTIDAGKTKTVTVTLWLHDPDRRLGDDNAQLSVSDLELILDTSQTTSVYFNDKTSCYNDPDSNGWGWVDNDGAKMWVYDAVANELREMKKVSASGDTWIGSVEKTSFDNTSSSTNLIFYNCAASVTRDNVRSNYICKWETNFAQAKRDNPVNRAYTACGYYRNVGTKTGIGTWGSVAKISLDSEDTNVLSRPADPNSATRVYFTDNATNITYQMNYREDTGVYYWQAYVPSTCNYPIFHMTVNSKAYTIGASKRDTAEMSSKFVITSATTGYWDPPAIIKVHLASGCEKMGTVSVTGGPANVTTVKVTKGISVYLDAVAASTQYGFKGWYNNASCNGVPHSNHYSFTPTESKEYNWYAKFLRQYKVTLKASSDEKCPDSSGGTVQIKISDTEHTSAGAEEDVYVLEGGSVTIVAAPKASHNFLGWFDDDAPTALPVYDATSKTKVISNIKGDVLLYAKYAIKTFKIEAQAKTEDSTDNDKGGTVKFGNDSQADSKDYVTTTVNYDGSVIFRAYAKDSDGYEFAGWYTDEACTKLESKANPYTVSNIRADKKLYAKFNLKRYDITAHAVSNGSLDSSTYGTVCRVVSGTAQTAGASAKAAQVKHGSTVTFRASEKTGASFGGWYSNAACTVKITTGLSGTGNKDLTITVPKYTNVYAKFTPISYTVTAYAGTGGQVKVNNKTYSSVSSQDSVLYNGSATLYAQANDGYQFVGWYTAATGGVEKADKNNPSYTEANITSDIQRYARFEKMSDKIIYLHDANNSFSSSNPPKIWYWSDSAPHAENDGYVWNTRPTMTLVSGYTNVWAYTLKGDSANANKFIFGETGEVKLDDKSHNMYNNKTATWSTFPPAVVTTNWYLKGTFNNWGTDNQMTSASSGSNVVETTRYLAVGDYEFKLNLSSNKTWYGYNNTITQTCTDVGFSSSGNNCKLKITSAGNFKFSYNTSNNRLTITKV